jgi:hypothetical protein
LCIGLLSVWENKGALIRQEISDEIELLEAVTEISNRASDAELERGFEVGSNMLKGD